MADILLNISSINELLFKVRKDIELFTYFKNFEDGIVNFFDIDKKSSILDMNFPLLWKLDSNTLMIPHIKSVPSYPDIYQVLLEHAINLKVDIKSCNNFVICGKIIECITDQIYSPNTYEIFFYDNSSYIKFTEFIKNTGDLFDIKNYHIKIHNKIFSSPLEILINIDKYTNRICFDCKKLDYFATVMFYLNLDKLSNDDNDLVKANIYFKTVNNRITIFGKIHRIVNSIDIDKLRNFQVNLDLSNSDYEILDDEGLTPIERALKIYLSLENPILQKNMKDIIDVLCQFNYRRPPYIFAYVLLQHTTSKIDLNSIYDSLHSCINKYNLLFNDNGIKPLICSDIIIPSINTFVVRELLYQNNAENIEDFIKYISYKDFDYGVLLVGKDNLRTLLPKIYTQSNSRLVHEIILKSEMIDIFNFIGKPKFNEIFIKAIVPQLLENSCYLSLLYLIKMQYPIFKLKYSKPLLHYIADSKLIITDNDCMNTIKFLNKYFDDITYFLYLSDKNGDTFLHRLSINKPYLIHYFLNISLDKDTNIKSLIKLHSKNKNGDTFLHLLVKKKYIDTIRLLIDIIKPIINLQNDNGETALIISARNNDEILYSLLKLNGANENIKDKYGNTVFHYICMNEMFLGSVIIETDNEYGYKPAHYTNLNSYWKYKELN